MANFDWNDADSADLIQKVFTGDINIANLPIELYEKTANYLTQGVYDVYGIGYDQSIMAPEFETIRHLKANIHVFSAAKTFQSILDIQSQLFDDDGNIRSFRDFEQRAAKIESLYNKAWLRAEYRTTINQARSAKNWDRYSSQKNTFPYLRYETKDDSKVRPEHASMDGITLPVDDPFWNQYFPPNGWNCRCTITQIRKATPTKLDQIGTTDDGTPEFKGVTLPDQLFRLNSGKHQVIFVDDKQKGLSHPYFKVDTRYKAYQDRNFDMPIPNDVKDLVKTAGEIKPPVVVNEWIDANTIAEFRDNLRKLYMDKWQIKTSIDLRGSDLTLGELNIRAKQLYKLLDEYKPSTTIQTDSIKRITFRSSTSSYGFVQPSKSVLGDISEINFGDKYDSRRSLDYFDLDFELKPKSIVDSDKLHISTLTHEFAHSISISTQQIKNDKNVNQFWIEMQRLRHEYNDELKSISGKGILKYNEKLISKYANTNLNELFAEGFCEYKLNSKPSKWAQKVGELADKYFKK